MTCCIGILDVPPGKWHAAFQARSLQLKSLVKLGKKDVAKAVPRAMGDPATTLRDMKQDWLNKVGRNLEDDLLMLPEKSLAKKPTKAQRNNSFMK